MPSMARMLEYCQANKEKWAAHEETEDEKMVYVKESDLNSNSSSDQDEEEIAD